MEKEEIEVNLTDEEFIFLARMAHERDITLNQLINDILKKEMNKDHEKLS